MDILIFYIKIYIYDFINVQWFYIIKVDNATLLIKHMTTIEVDNATLLTKKMTSRILLHAVSDILFISTKYRQNSNLWLSFSHAFFVAAIVFSQTFGGFIT